ncbi:MAG: P2 family phage major capsid protein, partial [Desulfobacteraceae bacterium]|nr:P2 family phage major capsid protein [Desulfobacteraceae bacterium]
MDKKTRQIFGQMTGRIAKTYGVTNVTEQFTATPSIEQRLQDKIVEQSSFLSRINVITVRDMEGENILGSASGPASGRTNTNVEGKERSPKDLLGLDAFKYKLYQTDSDVYMKFSTLDVWSKFKDFAQRYAKYVQQRIANDREIIGFFGEDAVADTNLTNFPLMQDVNKGWMQYMRENL